MTTLWSNTVHQTALPALSFVSGTLTTAAAIAAATAISTRKSCKQRTKPRSKLQPSIFIGVYSSICVCMYSHACNKPLKTISCSVCVCVAAVAADTAFGCGPPLPLSVY